MQVGYSGGSYQDAVRPIIALKAGQSRCKITGSRLLTIDRLREDPPKP